VITAFGETAQRYARGLSELNAVVTDIHSLVPAYLNALERRSRGESFYGMILADDRRVSLAYGTSLSIVRQFADIDVRMQAFDMLSGGTVRVGDRTAAEIWSETPLLHVCNEFYRLATGMLVRSYADFTKYAERPGALVRPVERVLVETVLPGFERVLPTTPAVVIWAPHRPAEQLALHLFALSEFAGEVWCVAASGGGEVAGVLPRAKVIPIDDPGLAGLLARTGCVVCVEPNDPGDAVAFARHGLGIVAPLTAGAHEFAPEVVVWDAANANALHQAVARALARPTAVRQAYVPPPPSPIVPAAPMPREQLPVVTVTIPTFNRPGGLRDALRAVAAQTYPNIDCVVVNDCGSPVDDVVAEFPFARLVENETNRGTIPTLEHGMLSGRGDYIAFLPDDDLIYPDHIERIMYALLRSGAKIAHGNGMLRYVERLPDGTWKTTGLNASVCGETLTPTTALIATPVSENAVVHHRSVFEEAGWWLDDSTLADLELHMRLGVRYVFVHVDVVTYEFREHSQNQAKFFDFPTELLRIYEQLHPVPERPNLAAHRKSTHAAMAARIPGRPAFPPTIRLT
jgi:hypothetical protein